MTLADACPVAALCGQLGYLATAAEVGQRFGILHNNQSDHGLFVAQSDEGALLAGFVHVYIERLLVSDPYAEIGALVVDANVRGRGIGRTLIVAAEQWARTQGCSEVRVRSGSARVEAHAFYQRAGYAFVKTQHRFRKEVGR